MDYMRSEDEIDDLLVYPTMDSISLRQRGSSSNVLVDEPRRNHDEEMTNERKIYRSQCNPIHVPDTARNVTWYDPFYENNGDNNATGIIIAAFDIDRETFRSWHNSLMAVLVIVMSLAEFFYFKLFPLYLVVTYGVVSMIAIEGDRRSKDHEIRRRHIAITRHGIYIDTVDEPTHQNLQLRKIIQFHDIKLGYIQQSYGFNPNSWLPQQIIIYRVILKSKGCTPNHVLDGIMKQQKFVDIVNEMIARSAEDNNVIVAEML